MTVSAFSCPPFTKDLLFTLFISSLSSLLCWLFRQKMEWFGLVLFLYSASGHLSLVSSASNSLYGKYSSYNVGYRESEIVSLLPVSLRPYFTRLSNPMRLYEATRLRGFFFFFTLSLSRPTSKSLFLSVPVLIPS